MPSASEHLGARTSVSARLRGRSRLGWWLPMALATLYVLVVLAHLPNIVHQIWLSSDTVAPGVFAQLYANAPAHTHVTLGDHAYFEEVAAMLLTRWLPAHRVVWYALPILCDLVALALMSWVIARLFGRWHAALVAAALACLAGPGLETFFATDDHVNSVVHAVVLCAAAVIVIPRARSIPRRRRLAVAVALGLLSGLPLAGDELFIGWALLPFLFTGVLGTWRGRREDASRVAEFVAVTVTCAVLTAVAFARIMHGAGFGAWAPAQHALLTFATPAVLAKNLGTTLQSLPWFDGGDFFGQPVNTQSALSFVTGAIVFAAVGAAVAIARTTTGRFRRLVYGQVDERLLYTAFWVTSLLAGWAMFMLGTPSASVGAARYLLGPFVAIVALLPATTSRGRSPRALGAIAVAVLAVVAVIRFARYPLGIAGPYPTAATAGQLAQFAESEHVHVGYGYYWDALDLTWNSEFHVQIFPITKCVSAPRKLCADDEVSMSNWFVPRPGVRSMLLVDPAAPEINAVDPAFGRPITSRPIGGLIAYVYPYDIAARLGPGQT